MNPLLDYFEANSGRLIHKWLHYFDIYHQHFARFRDRQPTVVEFGVFQGGSLRMWKHYFGEGVKIFGVDIEPRCKELEEENVSILIGDQEDRGFLQELVQQVGPIDILIDDGGHTMRQQITTFEETYPAVKETGVYLVEDLHTSYWRTEHGARYRGGFRKRSTFIEYSKRLIDHLNAWHIPDRRIQVDDFTRSTWSMTYYDSVLVIEKRPREEPYDRMTGEPAFPND